MFINFVCLLLSLSLNWISIQIVKPLDHPVPGRHTLLPRLLSQFHSGTSQAGTSRLPEYWRHPLLFIILILMSLCSNLGSDIIVSPPGSMTSRCPIPDHGVILLQSGSHQLRPGSRSSRSGILPRSNLSLSLPFFHSFLFLNTDSLIGKTIFHLPKIFDEFLGGARRGEGIP
jgi:hypothetical protein